MICDDTPSGTVTTGGRAGLPPTVSEAEFLTVTAHVSRTLYRRFGTCLGTAEDFGQQVVVWSLEALPAYDPSRKLEGFLMRHARNRALNYYRDNVSRRDYPCRRCHEGDVCSDGDVCEPYRRWAERNRSKAAIARPLGIEPALGVTTPSPVEPTVVYRELTELIDRELSLELRATYLQMLAGVKVESGRRKQVRRAVAGILVDAGVEVPDEVFEFLVDDDEQGGQAVPRPTKQDVGDPHSTLLC